MWFFWQIILILLFSHCETFCAGEDVGSPKEFLLTSSAASSASLPLQPVSVVDIASDVAAPRGGVAVSSHDNSQSASQHGEPDGVLRGAPLSMTPPRDTDRVFLSDDDSDEEKGTEVTHSQLIVLFGGDRSLFQNMPFAHPPLSQPAGVAVLNAPSVAVAANAVASPEATGTAIRLRHTQAPQPNLLTDPERVAFMETFDRVLFHNFPPRVVCRGLLRGQTTCELVTELFSGALAVVAIVPSCGVIVSIVGDFLGVSPGTVLDDFAIASTVVFTGLPQVEQFMHVGKMLPRDCTSVCCDKCRSCACECIRPHPDEAALTHPISRAHRAWQFVVGGASFLVSLALTKQMYDIQVGPAPVDPDADQDSDSEYAERVAGAKAFIPFVLFTEWGIRFLLAKQRLNDNYHRNVAPRKHSVRMKKALIRYAAERQGEIDARSHEMQLQRKKEAITKVTTSAVVKASREEEERGKEDVGSPQSADSDQKRVAAAEKVGKVDATSPQNAKSKKEEVKPFRTAELISTSNKEDPTLKRFLDEVNITEPSGREKFSDIISTMIVGIGTSARFKYLQYYLELGLISLEIPSPVTALVLSGIAAGYLGYAEYHAHRKNARKLLARKRKAEICVPQTGECFDKFKEIAKTTCSSIGGVILALKTTAMAKTATAPAVDAVVTLADIADRVIIVGSAALLDASTGYSFCRSNSNRICDRVTTFCRASFSRCYSKAEDTKQVLKSASRKFKGLLTRLTNDATDKLFDILYHPHAS